MLRVHKFPDGSTVLHGMVFSPEPSATRYSVWFSPDGQMTHCEGYSRRGRPCPVPAKVKPRLAAEWGLAKALAR